MLDSTEPTDQLNDDSSTVQAASEWHDAEHGAMFELGPEQQRDADDAEPHAGQAAMREAVAAKDEGLEHQKPDGNDGDDQRGKAGGDKLLGPGEPEVAAHQQQAADGRQPRGLPQRDAHAPARHGEPGQHQRSGNGEADGAHHRRRKPLLVGNADGQVRRAPEDVHQRKRKDDLEAVMAVGRHERQLSVVGCQLSEVLT